MPADTTPEREQELWDALCAARQHILDAGGVDVPAWAASRPAYRDEPGE